MPGPDVVARNVEDIYRVIKDAGLPVQVASLLVAQHEEIKTLQAYCGELSDHVAKVIEALKFSQAIHRQNKAALDKINARFQDPYLNDVKSEQTNGEG